ncbi:MAG TPA: hypothetical protein VFQ61_09195 [Polyangiaceae bacterium]|nr:hypothetical protein [Polyangiaceae bacterium]
MDGLRVLSCVEATGAGRRSAIRGPPGVDVGLSYEGWLLSGTSDGGSGLLESRDVSARCVDGSACKAFISPSAAAMICAWMWWV